MLGTVAMLATLSPSFDLSLSPRADTLEKQLRQVGRSQEIATKVAEDLRKWFGNDIKSGGNARTEETTAVWALEAASQPTVVSADGAIRVPLKAVGRTGVYAAVTRHKSGDAFRWSYEVGGKKIGGNLLEVYESEPDTREQPGIAKGTLTQQPQWASKVYPGTKRDWWVYVPADLKPGQAASVMVFQDGQWMKNYVPTVFDNLIAKGQMPKTVGIFLAPGSYEGGRSNRMFEYDRLTDDYVRMLIEEILPEVAKTVPLKTDPANRAICGMSSGGICAFTAAWQRPDQFGKVLSWIGSFVNIASGDSRREGGHNYPALIRKIDKKPIRVYLQDGENDLDNEHGNWPLANLEMAKSLAWKGYDHLLVYGKGAHNDKHGRAVLPSALRWLWRD